MVAGRRELTVPHGVHGGKQLTLEYREEGELAVVELVVIMVRHLEKRPFLEETTEVKPSMNEMSFVLKTYPLVLGSVVNQDSSLEETSSLFLEEVILMHSTYLPRNRYSHLVGKEPANEHQVVRLEQFVAGLEALLVLFPSVWLMLTLGFLSRYSSSFSSKGFLPQHLVPLQSLALYHPLL